MFISLINICPAFKSSFTTSLWPDYEARCSGVNPNSLYFSGSAPLSRSTLTTCLWPRFAAWYRGVDSTNPWTQFTSNHPATEECHHLLCIVFYCHVPEFVLIFGYFLFKDTLSLFPKWLRCDSFFPGFAHLMTFLEWFIVNWEEYNLKNMWHVHCEQFFKRTCSVYGYLSQARLG